MNGWNASTPNQNMYNPQAAHLNPQNLYTNSPTPSFDINSSQQQQQQQQQHFATPTPQTFNPASVVPAKRPHDGMSGSPSQQHSRSQTPSYAANFPSQQQPQQQQPPPFPNAPTPYQHLQQPGSNNATPSPTMSNQPFRPPTQPPPQQQQQQRMNNASPSPFPGQQQPQNFGGPMSPAPNAPNGMQQPGSMFNQQYNMSQAMGGMGGMPGAMAAQMGNMGNVQPNAQRQYQMKLMQQQQQLRASGMIPPRSLGGQPGQMGNFPGQSQPGAQMPNGMNMQQQQFQQQLQQQQIKRQQFLKALQGHAQQQGRPFNPTPTVQGKPVDLYTLWQVVTGAGGSQQVEQKGQWPAVAQKMGFPPQQIPTAPDELKTIHAMSIAQYERVWFNAKMQQKQEAARLNAQQMAGFGQQQQAQQSPTKSMTPQPNQFPPMQPAAQQMPQPQSTPIQTNATLPQNGMSTPQQMMGAAAAMNHHRRNSSVRKTEQMTPQSVAQSVSAHSPIATKQRPPSAKQETLGPLMKSQEGQSTHYEPLSRTTVENEYGGYDILALNELGATISRATPGHPTVDEMGVIDTKTITLSLASGIHAEVRYALDTLVIISHDQRVALNLENCEDLLDVIVDCAEEQSEALSEDAPEVSDALDLPAYEDIVRSAKAEAETLQDVPQFGTAAYDLDRAADKLIAITTMLRNFSFYEFNHQLLTSPPLIRWLSNTIRLVGTRNMLLRTFYNAQDFYKDMIIFLSNVTQSLELPSRDDALHILHFLLAFAPQPSPVYSESKGHVRFTSFVPATHKYLPPAVDCLAKLLARQDPNRMLYRSIFTANQSSLAVSESPLDLLTRAFALSISVLPDRTKGALGNSVQLRIVEARKAYLTQGMLAADILTTLAPGNDTELARAWIESEDGWAVGLLNLAALLSVDRNQAAPPKGREPGMDTDTFKLITYRALTMMKRLADKAGKGSLQNLRHAMSHGSANGLTNGNDHGDDDDDDELGLHVHEPKWEGIPQGHAILGALMMPNTDKVALGLLCGLHEMAMQPTTS